MADISKITLPSGTTYNIKDEVARNFINGGSFIVAWNGTGTATAANIPAGVKAGSVTGTLAAADAVPGAFYLVKSSTTPSEQTLDVYDEYVVIKPNVNDNTTWFWEKIGDTRLNLANILTDVAIDKKTDTVIGTDSTFTITQPTISLATGATAGTGVISVATGITSTSASGDNVSAMTGLGSPSTSTVLTGVKVTAQPTISLSAADSTATGKVGVLTNATATKTNVKATASGANTSWNSKDSKSAVTGITSPKFETVLKTVSPTSKKLSTTSITGCNGTVTASKATAATTQTTTTGTATSTVGNVDASSKNWLRAITVDGTTETLIISAAEMNTQNTTQFTFSDVTAAKKADSATTVATGSTVATSTTSNVGATIVESVASGTTVSALSGSGTPAASNVIGANSTFSITQPTVVLATGADSEESGIISVATDISKTTKYIGGSASGTAVGANGTAAVVTGYPNIVTDEVLGTGSTITVTPTTTNIKATASGANTQWNNKDSVTVLTNSTGLTLTHGQ